MSHASLPASADDDVGGPAPEESIAFVVDGAVDDDELTRLHRDAFRESVTEFIPWSRRLGRHSICWVTAYDDDRLVGFANVIGDGGPHAFLLDTVVDPAYQHRGIGRGLVTAAITEARTLGCRWLHADYEPRAAQFYEGVCGFRPSRAGLVRLQ